jgi:PKD repeat protein
MKNIFTFFILSISLVPIVNAQIGPDIQWQQCYGGSQSESFPRMKSTADGGYIISGATSSNDGDVSGLHGSSDDAWIVKVDSLGAIEWQHCYGGTSIDYGKEITQTQDGGYIFTVYIYSDNGDISFNHGGTDIWVVKIDATGNIIWEKSLGGSTSEIAYNIIQRSDGNYLVCGSALSNNGDVLGNHGNGDIWLVNLDPAGNILWQHCYGGSGSENPASIIELTDGNFLVAGVTSSINGDVSGNHGGTDGWALKVDTSGNILWKRCYGGTLDDKLIDVRETPSGYLFCAHTRSNNGDVSGNNGDLDYWVFRTDFSGNILNQHCFGGTNADWPEDLVEIGDGFAVFGVTNSNDGDVSGGHGTGINKSDMWLIRFDTLFNLTWSRCYGGYDNDYGFSLLSENEKLVCAGYSVSTDGDISCTNHGGFDFWLFKTEEECTVPLSSGFAYQQNTLDFIFTDQSTNAASWLWDFGDGSTSILPNPIHTYATPGIYSACQSIFNSCGFDSSCKIINTCGNVAADFGFTQNGLTFTFSDSSENATDWSWKFKSNAFSTLQNPVYTYSQPGIYTVSLIASNICGSDTTELVINTCGTLIPAFTYIASGLSVQFNDASSSNANSWKWYFGDGGISTLQNPLYTYATPGTYIVELDVWSDCENKYKTQTLVICIQAIASFTTQQNGASVEFDNLSTGAESYLWDFGNGSNSTLEEAPYYFVNEGDYNVCLIATNVCDTDTFCSLITTGIITTPDLCWTATYTDSIESDFFAYYVATDDSDNVYVTGTGGHATSNYYKKLTTVKYNASGDVQWVKHFDSGNINDTYILGEMTCDQNGNVYIIFSSYLLAKWGLVKYNSNGDQQWVYYGLAGEGMSQIAVDEFGNIFAGGGVDGNYLVIKFHPDNSIAWSETFDLGYSGNDLIDITAAPGGKVYACGICVSHSSYSQWDGITIAYDSSGNQLWISDYGGTTSSDDKVISDRDGNAYIYGSDSYYGDYPTSYFKKVGSPSYTKGIPGFTYYDDEAYGGDIGADSSGNCYVTALVDLGDHSQNMIIKFDPYGNIVWNKPLLGSNTFGTANYTGISIRKIKVNEAGDVYYTGYTKPYSANNDGYNVETGKINTDGEIEWLVNYDQAALEDYAYNMTIDHSENLIVIGKTETSPAQYEMLTLKYCEPCSYLQVALHLPMDTICFNWAPFALSGGIPVGGNYSVDGESSSTFDPLSAGLGLHQVSYTYDDGNGCIKTDTQELLVDVCTHANFYSADHLQFAVVPNPFSDFTSIQFFLEKNTPAKIELFDLHGVKIKTITEGNFEAGNHQAILPKENLGAGIYLLQLETSSGISIQKLIIQ